MTNQAKVLVLGSTGGIGGELTRQLLHANWQVCAMTRNLSRAKQSQAGVQWMKGDALNASQVEAAAQGCDVIIHAVNPPGYKNWEKWVLPMLDNTIAAARKIGATIVLPGTVYNFGPEVSLQIDENTPQHPQTRKGRIRVQLEQRLFNYAQNGGRVIIVRAGDFFGGQPGNNWFSQGLIKPGQAVSTINNPSQKGTAHQWSYIPDVAQVMRQLLERRHQLEAFAVYHMAGHWDANGRQMVETIRDVVLQHSGKTANIRSFPWGVVKLISPFNATMRELLEMRYLWQRPLQMNNSKLLAELGEEAHTPLALAVEQTLIGLQCLPAAAPT
ncbi:NAD(P)H-binding protein [Agarivorans sp. QJM3NY_25]|uniref:NAD(P)H-binding protein n=1 Tax=Agarivorans sp. QJM3NY_25 TaxID=3421430 RepID=UPI003D7E1378